MEVCRRHDVLTFDVITQDVNEDTTFVDHAETKKCCSLYRNPF